MKRIIILLLVLLLAGVTAVSADAEYQLLGRGAIPAQLGERVLTDEEINQLLHAEPELIRQRISTFPDYVAWLEAANAPYYMKVTSNPENQYTLGGGFNFDWCYQMLGVNMITDMALYILQDDFSGMQTMMAQFFWRGSSSEIFANIFPVEGGYIVLSADVYARNTVKPQGEQPVVEPIFVESMDGLIAFCQGPDRYFAGANSLAQVITISTTDRVYLNVNKQTGFYEPEGDAVTEVIFFDEAGRYPFPNSAPLLWDMGAPEEPVTSHINDYAAAKAIRLSGVEEAAASIKTLQDCLNYVYYSGYVSGDGDMSIPARNDVYWHYNYKPEVVFERHTGCCGATSGLVAYLLQGDYDEVGFVGITYEEGAGGGHVINYIKAGELYYVFDVFAWGMNGYSHEALACYADKDLNAAVLRWGERTGRVKSMYTYTNPAGGDAPVGWSTVKFRVSYLFKDYAQNVNIVLETPVEGYVYEFVDEDPRLLQGIELIRSVW